MLNKYALQALSPSNQRAKRKPADTMAMTDQRVAKTRNLPASGMMKSAQSFNVKQSPRESITEMNSEFERTNRNIDERLSHLADELKKRSK